jgi:hypothetical protein
MSWPWERTAQQTIQPKRLKALVKAIKYWPKISLIKNIDTFVIDLRCLTLYYYFDLSLGYFASKYICYEAYIQCKLNSSRDNTGIWKFVSSLFSFLFKYFRNVFSDGPEGQLKPFITLIGCYSGLRDKYQRQMQQNFQDNLWWIRD